MKKWLMILAIVAAGLAGLAIGLIGLTCRDTNVPPLTTDLVPERVEVADADNAYTHFNAAAEALDWPEYGTEEGKRVSRIIEQNESDPEFADDLLARNTEALARLDQGLRCRVCQPPAVTRITDLQPHTMTWRYLSSLLDLKFIRERETHRFAEATRTCCDLFRFGDVVHKDAVDGMNYSVGIGLLGKANIRARDLVDSKDITKDDLARLADTLAHLAPLDRGLTRSFQADYQVVAGLVDDLQAKYRKPSGYTLHPNKTKHAFADFYRSRIANVGRVWAEMGLCDAQAFYYRHESRFATAVGVNYIGKMYYDMFADPDSPLLETRCRYECLLAATRLVVACRRYEMDCGELPATLGALVPEYLDAVPRDPFDGKPFRYVRDKAIVYAVGMDLVDSGGSEKPTGEEAIKNDWQRLWFAEDAVSHIHGPDGTR